MAVGVAACGSGGATTGSEDATPESPQAYAAMAWASEVQEKVDDFMTHTAPSHLGTHQRDPLELAYEVKSGETNAIFYEVEGLVLPPICKKARGKVLNAIDHLRGETEGLVDRQDLSQDEYASLYDRRTKRVDEASRELSDLTSSLTCGGSAEIDPADPGVDEAQWGLEVKGLVREFELQRHTVQDFEDQEDVEFLYGLEGFTARTLQSEIQEAKQPASCEETRGEILDVLARIEKQREALDERSDLDEKEYFALLRQQTGEIDESERELRDLTSPITC